MDIQQLFSQSGKSQSRPLVEAQIYTLKEALAAYRRPCPFAVGDVVFARSNAYLVAKGDQYPYVVVDVATPEIRWACGMTGMKLDVRVAWVDDDGDVAVAWAESWCFEPYKPGEKKS